MRNVTWTHDGYAVTSWGNGLAYTVTGPDGRDCFLQGDDAAEWRAEYESAPDAAAFLHETISNYGSN